MNRTHLSLALTAAAVAALTLSAEDFRPLMKTTHTTWPDKQHIGVICDYRASEEQVKALAAAAGEGYRITVADTHNGEKANFAATLLADRHADYLVLMPGDPVFREGSFNASVAVYRLAAKGVPSIGTTPVALKQGAVFSVGEGTSGHILVNDQLIGTVHVILPDEVKESEKGALVLEQKGMATISVHPAE